MARFTCPFIKRDGTVCGNICYDPRGCYRHWKLYEKNMKKKPCLNCNFPADTGTEYCAKFCSKYSAKFHSHNYRMRQKYKAETEALQSAKTSELSDETLQPRIPEAPISELSDVDGTLQLIISGALIFELSDVAKPLQPRIYEAPVFESDDEDVGLDLFGD
ncbi:hypothetical protein RhiirC2_720492 [Rhizophagus irregularis]|uniref:Uncharacterized protein n=1 Tax=Rhizophagus irregularis TaxID=588596 RepID=A0A2N1MA22_9GLOM|nr:hypothetical protein RhiirC2_720492 [Rhizophagus irregularis]